MDMIGGVIVQIGHGKQLNAKVQLRIRIIIFYFHSLLLHYKKYSLLGKKDNH